MSVPEPEPGPERDILDRLLARLHVLMASLNDDLAWLGEVPGDQRTFDEMPSHRRSASRAALKSFEQIEDQLARASRVIPTLVGQSAKGWFARDHADYMEGLGVLDDAARWTAIVRLRNELVHDYPLDPQVQFDRFRRAMDAVPDLARALAGLTRFVAQELERHRI